MKILTSIAAIILIITPSICIDLDFKNSFKAKAKATAAKIELVGVDEPTPSDLLCIPIECFNEIGQWVRRSTGVPISNHKVLTCGHCVQNSLDLFNHSVQLDSAWGKIVVAGNLATIKKPSPDDSISAILEISDPALELPQYIERGRPVEGIAFVIRFNTIYKINIYDVNQQVFSGWQPIPGTSGSPIVQKINDKWVLVGLVRAWIIKEVDDGIKRGLYSSVSTDE